MTTMHTFAIYVEDRPGVLNRIASLFRRRGFNIHSLAVGDSESPGVSRMTVVVQADSGGALRIRAHLCKLVNVRRVEAITSHASVARELALIKVNADHGNRSSLMQLAQVFDARILDVAADSLVIEVTASPSRIDSLLDVLRPYGVVEVARTGCIAMTRSAAPEITALPMAFAHEPEAGVSYSV